MAITKKCIVVLISLSFITAMFTPAYTEYAHAAAKKPATPTIKGFNTSLLYRSKRQIGICWSKAKNAKKYEL